MNQPLTVYKMDAEQELEYTDDEIRDELNKLGYQNVPDQRLREFKRDLKVLIQHERSKSSQNTSLSSNEQTDALESFMGPSYKNDRYTLPTHQGHQDLNRNASHFSDDKENRHDHGQPIFKNSLAPQPSHFHDHCSMYDSRLETTDLRDDVSESGSERRFVKRKVLRKKLDGSKVIDESFTESETGSLLDINERLRLLGIGDTDSRRPRTAQSEPPYRLAPDDPRPASVILRASEHPHTKNLRKSDPVARYQQFRQSWSQQRAPGEQSHKQLRWNIREQMLSQDQVIEKKAPRVFVPNSYVVPTEKKRKSLRWQIRMDLAQGQMPPHGFYHEY